MTMVDVDGVLFAFVEGVQWIKYDDTRYYRKHFQDVRSGTKGVDLIVVAAGTSGYLVEVKDYRRPKTELPDRLDEDLMGKTLDTMSGLVALRFAHSAAQQEAEMASRLFDCQSLTVVLHCAVPDDPDWVQWLADLRDKVHQRFRRLGLDIYIATSRIQPDTLPWTAH